MGTQGIDPNFSNALSNLAAGVSGMQGAYIRGQQLGMQQFNADRNFGLARDNYNLKVDQFNAEAPYREARVSSLEASARAANALAAEREAKNLAISLFPNAVSDALAWNEGTPDIPAFGMEDVRQSRAPSQWDTIPGTSTPGSFAVERNPNLLAKVISGGVAAGLTPDQAIDVVRRGVGTNRLLTAAPGSNESIVAQSLMDPGSMNSVINNRESIAAQQPVRESVVERNKASAEASKASAGASSALEAQRKVKTEQLKTSGGAKANPITLTEYNTIIQMSPGLLRAHLNNRFPPSSYSSNDADSVNEAMEAWIADPAINDRVRQIMMDVFGRTGDAQQAAAAVDAWLSSQTVDLGIFDNDYLFTGDTALKSEGKPLPPEIASLIPLAAPATSPAAAVAPAAAEAAPAPAAGASPAVSAPPTPTGPTIPPVLPTTPPALTGPGAASVFAPMPAPTPLVAPPPAAPVAPAASAPAVSAPAPVAPAPVAPAPAAPAGPIAEPSTPAAAVSQPEQMTAEQGDAAYRQATGQDDIDEFDGIGVGVKDSKTKDASPGKQKQTGKPLLANDKPIAPADTLSDPTLLYGRRPVPATNATAQMVRDIDSYVNSEDGINSKTARTPFENQFVSLYKELKSYAKFIDTRRTELAPKGIRAEIEFNSSFAKDADIAYAQQKVNEINEKIRFLMERPFARISPSAAMLDQFAFYGDDPSRAYIMPSVSSVPPESRGNHVTPNEIRFLLQGAMANGTFISGEMGNNPTLSVLAEKALSGDLSDVYYDVPGRGKVPAEEVFRQFDTENAGLERRVIKNGDLNMKPGDSLARTLFNLHLLANKEIQLYRSAMRSSGRKDWFDSSNFTSSLPGVNMVANAFSDRPGLPLEEMRSGSPAYLKAHPIPKID